VTANSPDIYRTRAPASGEQVTRLAALPYDGGHRPRWSFWESLDGAVMRISKYAAVLGVVYVLGGEVFLEEEWRFSHFAGLRLGNTQGTSEAAAAPGKAEAKIVEAHAEAEAHKIIGEGEAVRAQAVETAKSRVEAAKSCLIARDQHAQRIAASCLSRVDRPSICDQSLANAKAGWCSEYEDILGDAIW